jgi:hypothetical protein
MADTDTVQASLMIEQCKPSVALSLTSTAASMVISLGYHRASTMKLDTVRERNEKIFLFWMVYLMDTSFAVRLGRAPVIPESDITVPMVTHGGCLPSEFVDVFCYWVEVGRTRCQTVEQLYSPAALQQSHRERSNRAKQLSDRLEEAWSLRSKVRKCQSHTEACSFHSLTQLELLLQQPRSVVAASLR